MYIEVSEKKINKMKEELDKRGISYHVTDCTLPTERARHYHIDFGENNPELAYVVQGIYEKISRESAPSVTQKPKKEKNKENEIENQL